MKYFTACLLLLFFNLKSFGQNTDINKNRFDLKGILKGRDTGKIVLWYPNPEGKYIKDTTRLANGRFEFKGRIKEPSYVHLIGSKQNGNYASFYLEQGNQQLFLEENKFDDLKMIGSFSQMQNDTLTKIGKSIFSRYDRWIKERDSALIQFVEEKDPIAKARLKYRFDSLDKRNEEIYTANRNETVYFMNQHTDSYVSPTYLYGFLTSGTIGTDSAQMVFNRFSLRIRNSHAGKLIQDELKKRQLNITASDFATTDVKGENFSLSSLKGKYVLIDFWASWCGPCLEKLPELKNFWNKYSSKGFEIVAVSIDVDKNKWESSIKKNGIQHFHHVLSNEDIKSKYSNPSLPIPNQILVNKEGKIIWNSVNQSGDLKAVLEKEFLE